MKKYLILIVLLIICLNLNSFNYDRYKVLTVDEFILNIEKSANDGPPGITFFYLFPFAIPS